MAPKRQLQGYPKDFKKEVIELWTTNRFESQQALIKHVQEKKKVTINPKTLSDWLGKLRDKVLQGPPGNRMRDRAPLIPDLDALLHEYVLTHNLLGGTVTDASIAEAAMDAFKSLQARGKVGPNVQFKASSGFVSGFKRRFNLSSHMRCGESGSADTEGIQLAREALPKILADLKIVRACDVWNCDETGLRWVAPPDRTICDRRPDGYKKAMDRITLLVTCNATGTGRRPLMVLGKSENPHCFRKHDVRKLVHYRAQESAWMNLALFTEWLDTFNRWCMNQGRCIVLLMDNASAHMTPSGTESQMHGLKVRCLSHMTVVYLPANTTSVVQPCDQGIIRSLKAAYRRSLVEWQYSKWKELKPLLDAQSATASGSGLPTTAQATTASGSGLPTTAQSATASGSGLPTTAQATTASGRLGSLLACQIGAETPTSTVGQKRPRRTRSDKPLSLARYKPTLSDAIQWAHAAWEGIPNSVIQNSWRQSGLLPDCFWEVEGIGRMEQGGTAEQAVAEAYAATDDILTEFRQYFPQTPTAAEYAESMPGEDLALEQPPTVTDFVEQILAADSSSSEDEEEEEEEKVTEEEYERSFKKVEKFVQQNSELFGPKIAGNLFFMKQAWERRKIQLELRRKSGQACIRHFVS